MLVWEDDHRSPQAPLPRPLDSAFDRNARTPAPSLREVQSSAPVLTQTVGATAVTPSKAQGVANTAASSVVAKTERRVTAAEKRIINGQTDVNQLVPFKYK